MGNRRSLLREFRVAAPPAGRAVAVSREEHAGAALRAVRPLPGDPVAVDFVELPLEAGRALLLLRLGHHFASFFLPSGFFSAFFTSFFSAGFFSSLPAGFFSSFGAPFSGFASGFASAFGASAFGGTAGFSAFSARGTGAGLSGFGASLTSGSISLLRTRMCLRSTASASSFDL